MKHQMQFRILYTGFEKNVQSRLELIVARNKQVFEKIFIMQDPTAENTDILNIHIQFHCFAEHKDKDGFKQQEQIIQNSRILCVGDFNNFEEILQCVRSGSFACISFADLYAEIIPAITFALKNKCYISSSFFPALNSFFQINETQQVSSSLLTQREYRLIELLTMGAMYKEVAWKLKISENTVRSHIRNIYSKLKVHSKTELTQKILSYKIMSSIAYFFSDYVACLCY